MQMHLDPQANTSMPCHVAKHSIGRRNSTKASALKILKSANSCRQAQKPQLSFESILPSRRALMSKEAAWNLQFRTSVQFCRDPGRGRDETGPSFPCQCNSAEAKHRSVAECSSACGHSARGVFRQQSRTNQILPGRSPSIVFSHGFVTVSNLVGARRLRFFSNNS